MGHCMHWVPLVCPWHCMHAPPSMLRGTALEFRTVLQHMEGEVTELTDEVERLQRFSSGSISTAVRATALVKVALYACSA